MKIEKAKITDIEILTQLSKITFDDDTQKHGLGDEGGPPGYDSIEWQRSIMTEGLYYKIVQDNKIIGGLILFKKGKKHIEVGRIYIHPDFQNQGLGTLIFNSLETLFPQTEKWTLDTPSWAHRNHHFYKKVGYTKVGEMSLENEENTLFLFEKNIFRISEEK
ncbi:MAG: GNAT family N-acetyltransferase [Candidatus Hodarchaeota archaeon]